MAADTYNLMAGAYSISFDGEDMGRTEVGFEEVIRPSFIPIRCDNTGRTPVDGLITGVEDIIVRVNAIEWSRVAWVKLLKYLTYKTSDGSFGDAVSEGVVAPAGSLVSAISGELILTPITGAAAASNAGGVYTYGRASPLEPVRTVFSSQRLRSTSMGFSVFASAVTSNVATMYTTSYTA